MDAAIITVSCYIVGEKFLIPQLKQIFFIQGIIFASILVLAVVAVLLFKMWYQSTMKMCKSTRRMEGKTVIVTGANTGTLTNTGIIKIPG